MNLITRYVHDNNDISKLLMFDRKLETMCTSCNWICFAVTKNNNRKFDLSQTNVKGLIVQIQSSRNLFLYDDWSLSFG